VGANAATDEKLTEDRRGLVPHVKGREAQWLRPLCLPGLARVTAKPGVPSGSVELTSVLTE